MLETSYGGGGGLADADLAAKVDKTTTVNGHALDADVTVTKADVGLGNVDNTSDANKPVSTATQAALDAKEATANKGQANGYASLGSDGKIPTSQIPAALLGAVDFQGLWESDANLPPIPAAAAGNKGWYYRVSTDGSTNIDGISDWKVGDWIISDGIAWSKVDNTDQVMSVAGKQGNVILVKADVGLGNVDNTSDADKPISTATQAALNAKEATANKGQANGYASLGGDGKVPGAQLPEFPAAANPIPAGGTTGQVLTKVDGVDYHTQWTTAATRNVLTQDTTFYVRTDGNDLNSGLANTVGGAYRTWQGAYNALMKYDLAGFTATVQVGDGVYTGGLSCLVPIFGGTVVWQGNAASPANVVLSTTGTDAIVVRGQGHNISFKNFRIQTTGANCHGLHALKDGLCTFQGIDFGACGGNHMDAEQSGQIICTGNYTISGGATSHWATYSIGQVNVRGFTVTLTGTPAFSVGFAYAETNSIQYVDANTFTGAATGQRYQSKTNAVINTNAAGANYLPGNSVGSVDGNGGRYV